MKVKAFLGMVGIGTLAVVLIATNPSQDRYNTFAADTLQEEARSAFCQAQELDSWLGEIGKALGDICTTAIEQGRIIGQTELENFIEDHTQRQNFGLFSLYTTEIPAVQVKSLGILNRFIPLQQTVG